MLLSDEKINRTFAALSDSTRRKIVEILVNGNAKTVFELAVDFDQSRQSVTKHLNILCDAGIVLTQKDGRQRLSRLNEEAFSPINEWLSHYDQFWGQKMGELKNLIEKGEKK